MTTKIPPWLRTTIVGVIAFVAGGLLQPVLVSYGVSFLEWLRPANAEIDFEITTHDPDELRAYFTNEGDLSAGVFRLDVCPPNLGIFQNFQDANDWKTIKAVIPDPREGDYDQFFRLSKKADRNWRATCQQDGLMTPKRVVSHDRTIPADGAVEITFEAPSGFNMYSFKSDDAVAFGPVCVVGLDTTRGYFSKWFPCLHDP